jgi:hypothetical protein
MDDHVTYRVWPYSRWKMINTFVVLPLLLLIAIIMLHESLYRISPHLLVFVVVALVIVIKYITGGEPLTLTPSSLILGKKSIDPSRISLVEIHGLKISIGMHNGKKKSFKLFKKSALQLQPFIDDLQNYVWKYGIEVSVFQE